MQIGRKRSWYIRNGSFYSRAEETGFEEISEGEIGDRKAVHSFMGYKKEANSSALYEGRYKALEIYPNTVLFQNPVGGLECFTLMDAVNIMQGIPI